MGDFRIVINAVGGHGCEREKKDGEKVYGCGRMDCPDCLTAKFIADLARSGAMVRDARLEHWPDTPQGVIDEFDLTMEKPPAAYASKVTRTRKGSF